jgi:hypothetical protein
MAYEVVIFNHVTKSTNQRSSSTNARAMWGTIQAALDTGLGDFGYNWFPRKLGLLHLPDFFLCQGSNTAEVTADAK